jgi:hypothetical protein
MQQEISYFSCPTVSLDLVGVPSFERVDAGAAVNDFDSEVERIRLKVAAIFAAPRSEP